MKKHILFIAIFLSLNTLVSATTVQGTIKKTGPFTIGVFIKPIGGNITGAIANFNITISIDDSPAPSLSDITSLPGTAINALNVELLAGRYAYAFVVTGNVTGGISWNNGTEYQILSATFPDPASAGEKIQLNDYTGLGGGNSGQALFDIGVNGVFYVDYASMFYGSNVMNIEGGNSSVQALFPLPITLLSFNAEKSDDNKSAQLTWSTASESNSSYFGIERSTDRINWKTIGQVNAVGNSQIITNYEFLDKNVNLGSQSNLIVYYRLKMVDRDDSFKYSPIESVNFGNGRDALSEENEFLVYPNPATEGINVEWSSSLVDQPTQLEFYDLAGKLVHVEKIADQTNQQYVDFTKTSIQSGLCLMRIMSGDKPIEYKQIVVGQDH